MRNGFRQSMTWLHTWTGLLLGWVLFAVFLTGTASYYRWEITHWMQPELRQSAPPAEAARAAILRLETVAADSPQWFIDLPDDRTRSTQLLWRVPGEGRRFERETLAAAGGDKVQARDTLGGDFLYRFHFQFHLPPFWGRLLAGVAAMFMFIALITGVIAHRRFFADFFTFRPGRAGLRSWLDFHNVCGVLALPFYFMITYSALVIFAALYLPWSRQVLAEPGATPPPRMTRVATPEVSGKSWIQGASLTPMIQAAEERWGQGGPSLKRIEVQGRGSSSCVVTLTRHGGEKISISSPDKLQFNGVTGALVPPKSDASGPATRTKDFLYGLHVARFASPLLRGLFFLMGLMGSALIATGLVLWTLKRRPRRPGERASYGHGLVERFNVATLVGLPAAIAAYFGANRLLPLTLQGRADTEILCFFGLWLASLLHALFRPRTAAWREQLFVVSALYLLLPFLDLLVGTERLWEAISTLDLVHLGFDAAMFFCGVLCLAAFRRVNRGPGDGSGGLSLSRKDEAPAVMEEQLRS